MNSKLVFITTYPPRECGIATFTKDLVRAIKTQMDDSIEIDICALEDGYQGFDYPKEVKYVLDTTNPDKYIEFAEELNDDPQVKAIMIQHEFGLYGGEYGNYILEMIFTLEKPVFTTFHTILPHPDEKRLQIVRSITDHSKGILVMTENSKKILLDHYNLPEEKIDVVPHGTHMVLWKRKDEARARIGINNSPILATFGLLGRNKSIETAIDALPEIKKYFPDVLYLVLGKTHPGLVKHEGEKYRDFLEERVKQLGLEENVKFVNHFLELDELLDYLSITDIYLFTSKDPNQAVSGTFSYAMSSACPIIATPIPHAKELLTEDTGILIDFERPDQLAEAAIRLLKDDELRKRMGKNAFHKTRYTVWENVATRVMSLFRPFIEYSNYRYRIPQINLKHIEHMTTEKGIIQFADIDIADINSGYTLDDNARALIALTRHYELTNEVSDLRLINIYLDYIIYCQRSDGSFINYVDEDGSIHMRNNVENLDDANGRAMWALGYFISKDIFKDTLVEKAEACFKKALNVVEDIRSPRAMSYIIKGIYFYNKKKENEKNKELVKIFTERLLENFNKVADKNWYWFEEYMTYANAVIPSALLYAWKITGNISYHIIAKATFDFLLSKIFKDGQIRVISNRGWLKKGEQPTDGYGEQPIDVACTILALDLFYSELGELQYFTKLNIAFDWFLGRNRIHQIVYNPVTGGCYDGLEKDGVNLNQGAESTVSYLLSRLVMEKYYREKKRKTSEPVYHEKQLEKLLNNKG
ncbi:MAG: glycosyltransferase [Chlorobi bacterium]|nr:glycosyltransferase [Chlorobiota bacterium]